MNEKRLPDSAGYALDKFFVAVQSLATGPGDVRSRLYNAYMSFHPVQTGDLPEDLRDDFEWIQTQLTKYDELYPGQKAKLQEAGMENHLPGSIRATLSRIKNKTGAKIAERIFRIYLELDERIGNSSS